MPTLFAAGADLTAAQLNALVTNTTAISLAAASSNQSIAGAADIAGCSITLNTVSPNVQILIFGVYDVNIGSGNGGALLIGTCTVSTVSGGAAFPNEAHFGGFPNTTTARGSTAQIWFATLVTPGSHTIKLRGGISTGSQVQTMAQHTTLTVYQFAI